MTRAASAGKPSTGAVGGRGVGSVVLRVVLVVVVWVLGVVVVVPSAFAAKEVVGFVGGPQGDSGDQVRLLSDLAVYEATGDVYVLDSSRNGVNNRVVRRSAEGEFELAWGRDVVAGNGGTGFEVCTVASECKAGLEGQSSGEFINPSGVAVDQSDGSVYVWDARAASDAVPTRVNVRVQKFDADGNFVLMFGEGVNASTGGDVCTQVSGDVCRAGVSGSAPGQLGNPSNSEPTLAVSPLDGDVFVADPTNRRVQRFDSDGTFVGVIGSSANFGSTQPRRVTVDSRGVVYASDSNSGGQIDRFDSAGVHGPPGFLASIAVPPLLAGTSSTATVGLEVDPDSEGDGAAGADTDRLYVLRDPTAGSTVVQQLDSPGEIAAPGSVTATHGSAAGFAGVAGLGLNSASGSLYIAGSGSVPACGADCFGYFILDDDGTGGDVVASGVAGSSATATTIEMLGTVDPDGGLVRYRFEYSADGLNYSVMPYRSLFGTAGEVSQQLTGLDPNTVYRVRLRVEKILGPTILVSDVSPDSLTATAASAPQATTLGSTDRTDTTVTLRGLVDPNGSATSYRFEYGPAGGAFDRRIPIPDAPAGNSNTASMVLQHVTGLLPDTSYHYRLVATNATGQHAASAVVFTTTSAPAAGAAAQARGYELVSPADKVGGIGVGLWYVGPGAIASSSGAGAYEGERFAVQGGTGNMLVNSAQGYANDWAFAERAGDSVGWRSHPAITHPASNEQIARAASIIAASDDLSTTVMRTNAGGVLAVFPELATWMGEGFGPSYVVDWEGRWELFGPTARDQIRPGIGTNDGILWDNFVSSDGSWVFGSAGKDDISGKPAVAGLAGPGDPSHWGRPDLVGGRAVYAADLSAGPSDEFVVSGSRTNVGVCTVGTVVPRGDGGSGKIDGQACPAPVGDSQDRLVSDYGATLQAVDVNKPNVTTSMDGVVSEDGSRVFFMSPDPLASGVPDGTSAFCSGADDTTLCPPQLYVRQRNPDGSFSTRWVSRAEDGLFGNQDAGLTGAVRFEGASRDGRRVFFRTNSPLTVDDPNGGAQVPGGVVAGTASNQSWDLYMYELPAGPGSDPADGTLTRVSAGPDGDADCNVTAGTVDAGALRFVSDDGTRGYFTCAAPLGGVGVSGSGTIVEPGGTTTTTDAANLYAFDGAGSGSWSFVSRLPRSGISVGAIAGCATTGTGPQAPLGASSTTGHPDVGLIASRSNCVRGTSDGEFVTFWTTGRLTGDDPDEGSADIYGYDLETDELTRLTAAQGGVGGSYNCGYDNLGTPGVDESLQQCFGDGGFDESFDPIRRGPLPSLGVATDPLVAGDRVAFFQSRSRLVAEDVDDAYDVYEWRNGDLSLVSTGTSDTDGAFYKGNDRTGRNVYFVTLDKYSWQDFDAVADVYTARVGGGISRPSQPVVCPVLASGCQGGGFGGVSSLPVTSRVGSGGDAVTGSRRTLWVGGLSRKARRRASRTGVVVVSVRSSGAGRVTATARGRIDGRVRRVARESVRLEAAGKARLRLGLSRAARRRLGRGRALRVIVRVTSPGARSRAIAVRLPGVGS